MSPQILVTGPMIPSLMEALEKEFTVHKLWMPPDQDYFLQACGPSIQGLVTSYIYGAEIELLKTLPNLEIIANYGVGIDRIDMDCVKTKELTVTNTPDISEPVADTALALLLAVTRRICEADRFVKSGQWPKTAFPFGVDLGQKTCGIVGLGRIGKAIAKRAEAFGMRIAYFGPNKKADVPYTYYANLIDLAFESDFLILALPGGPDTYHMINEQVLVALGPGGYLINIARGSVLDEVALIRRLQAGQLAGAGLDVFEQEPLASSPLMTLDNVVLSPHIASATVETRHDMGEVVLHNLRAYFSNQPVLTPVVLGKSPANL
jgi:hydroxypyruvate reductase